MASSSDLSSSALGSLLPGSVGGLRLETRRNEGLLLDQNPLGGGPCDGQQQEPIVVLSSAVEASTSQSNAEKAAGNTFSQGLVFGSVSSLFSPGLVFV